MYPFGQVSTEIETEPGMQSPSRDMSRTSMAPSWHLLLPSPLQLSSPGITKIRKKVESWLAGHRASFSREEMDAVPILRELLLRPRQLLSLLWPAPHAPALESRPHRRQGYHLRKPTNTGKPRMRAEDGWRLHCCHKPTRSQSPNYTSLDCERKGFGVVLFLPALSLSLSLSRSLTSGAYSNLAAKRRVLDPETKNPPRKPS